MALTWGSCLPPLRRIKPHTEPPRTAAARAPVPAAGHCWSTPPQETLKHSEAGLAESPGIITPFPGSRCTQGFVFALQASLAGMRFDFKCDCAPPTILLQLFICPWMWGIIFGGFQHFPVNGCSAASCSFGVLAGEDECTSFYSAIFVVPPRIIISSRSFEVGQIWIWVLPLYSLAIWSWANKANQLQPYWIW